MIQKPKVRRDRGRATHLSTKELVGPSEVWFTQPIEQNELEAVAILKAEALLYKRIADARGDHHRRRATGEWPTLQEWFDYWLARRYGGAWRQRLSNTKCRSADQEVALRWRVHLGPHLGALPMASIRPADISRVLFQALGHQSPSTLANYRIILGCMWDDAMTHGWDSGTEVVWRATHNPVLSVPVPKIERVIRRVLTDDQCRAVLQQLERTWGRHHRFTVCCALLASLGLRLSEAMGLRWGQVVLDPGVIEGAAGYLIWQPRERKAGIPLRLPIPHELASYFPETRGAPDDFVLQQGGRAEGQNVAIRSAAAALGIDPTGLSSHTFRRSLATSLYLTGRTVDDVRRALGHRHVQTTWRYLQLEHAADEVAGTVMPRASKLLGGDT